MGDEREVQKLAKTISAVGQAVVKINKYLKKNNELLKIAVLSQLRGSPNQDAPSRYFRHHQISNEIL